MYKAKIAPSITCANLWKLDQEVKALEKGGADLLHIDIMDGHFVENFAVGTDFIEALSKNTSIPLEVHLQVTNPERYVDVFGKLGADIYTFHIEACDRLHQMKEQIEEYDMKMGVALNPCTQISALDTALSKVDMVTVMTVDPGFAGQKFVEGGLEKVKQLRSKSREINPDLDIAVDGNINKENINRTAAKGANVFVLGTSSIFTEGDREKLTKKFSIIADKAVEKGRD